MTAFKSVTIGAALSLAMLNALPANAGGMGQFGYSSGYSGGKARIRCGRTGCYERSGATAAQPAVDAGKPRR